MNEDFLGLLKNRDNLLTTYRGKVGKKIVYALSLFQVVDEVMNRYARTSEHRDSAQHVGT